MKKLIMISKKTVYSGLACIVVGLIIGLFIKYFKVLRFDFEVSVFELFALFVTVVLAWWVAEKLEKDSNKERCEKDIIIEKLKSMDVLIEKLNNKIEENAVIPLSSVTSIIESIDAHSNRVLDQIKKHYPSVTDNNQNVDYTAELNLLDDLCTNDDDGGLESAIVDGQTVCLYTPGKKEEISTCSNSLSDKIFNLEILINRA